jgi:hypothetical protein
MAIPKIRPSDAWWTGPVGGVDSGSIGSSGSSESEDKSESFRYQQGMPIRTVAANLKGRVNRRLRKQAIVAILALADNLLARKSLALKLVLQAA